LNITIKYSQTETDLVFHSRLWLWVLVFLLVRHLSHQNSSQAICKQWQRPCPRHL